MKIFLHYVVMALLVHASANAQLVTVSVKHASLRSVMSSIHKQTGYGYLMDPKFSDSSKPVTADFKEMVLDQALQLIMINQPFEYEIVYRTIILNAKPERLIPPLIDNIALQYETGLRGTVLNSEDKPAINATVRVKGIQYKGAYVDTKGGFYILNAPHKGIITISSIGYETIETSYCKDTQLIFHLKAMSYGLNEKVIEAYYGTTKELTTSSTVDVKADVIGNQPVSNPLMTLPGNASGVYVTPGSGVPGSYIRLNIRGTNSIAGGTDPFYVIDGIPVGSSTLSQIPSAAFGGLSPFGGVRITNIESISIFKDADATAIYGSRGANGVIFITTQKAEANKTRFDVNVYSGTGAVTHKLPLMDKTEYLKMRRETLKNDKADVGDKDYDLNGTWDTSRYTNWQNKFIGNQAKVTDASAAFYYGNKRTQVMIGGGYRKENTVYPGNFFNENAAAQLNMGHSFLNNVMHINIGGNYTNNRYNLPTTDFANLIYTAPVAPAVEDNKGGLNWMDNTYDNPWAKLYQKTNSITENLMGNVVLSCNLLRNLQITTSWGYNSSELNEHSAVPLISIMPVAGLSSKRREVVKGSNQLKTVIFEPQINYNIDKNGHSISALVGATFQKDTKSGSLLTASDFMSDAEMDNLAAATNTTESFTYNQYKYNAIFARVGYNYARKYIVNFTGRRDGSSRFGPGKQFGNFGAIGVAWIFTKEEAIHKRLSFLSFGKLRASAGKTGNDQLLDYQFLNIYSPSLGYFGENGVKPAQLINPSYSWETINKKDVALELGFWEDRLLVIINAYLNRTSNQLLGQSLSSVTGFNTVMANLPAIIQNSGIELDITLSKIVIHSFTLKSSLNFSRPRNKLVSFKDLAHTNYWNMLTVGQPVTNRMLYHNDGIDQEKGIYTFGNLNEEGMLNRVSVKVGQQYFGGFRNSVTYNKVFSLDVLFQFVKQSGFSFNGVTTPGRFLDPGSNQSREFLNSWQKPNDKAKYQKFSARQDADDSFTKFNQSDMGIVDASFIRLKNISLSWLLPEVNPKGWLKRYKYQSAKIYIEGQNLWTITSFKGMDPETQQVGLNKPPLPTLRFITVGLKASF